MDIELILDVFSVIDFSGFPPSIVAAAAVVAAAGESADLPETFYERVNKVILRFVKYIHLVRLKMAFGVHYVVLPVIYTRFHFGIFCRLKQCTLFFSLQCSPSLIVYSYSMFKQTIRKIRCQSKAREMMH